MITINRSPRYRHSLAFGLAALLSISLLPSFGQKAAPKKPDEGVIKEAQGSDAPTPAAKEVNSRPTLLTTMSREERMAWTEKQKAEKDSTTAAQTLPIIDVTPKRITIPGELTLRVRVNKATPADPGDIVHSYGYGGSRTAVRSGILGKNVPVGTWTEPKGFGDILKGDSEMLKGKAAEAAARQTARKPAKGAAAEPTVDVPRQLFLRICAGTPGLQKRIVNADGSISRPLEGYATQVEIEVEIAYNGKPVKSFKSFAPDGGTFTVRFPFARMKDNSPSTPEFLAGICDILDVAKERTANLKNEPWGKKPVPPLKYSIVSNFGGYGKGRGHDIATSNIEVILAEMECMQQLGINGMRGGEDEFAELSGRENDIRKDFTRNYLSHMLGYPVPREARKGGAQDEVRCPSHPNVKTRTEQGLQADIVRLKNHNADEVWGLTVDEIGSVTDAGHLAACPYCIPAYQEWLKGKGLSPKDFGKKDWSEVKPVGDAKPEEWKKNAGLALSIYYTARFRNEASARLFGPFRDAFNAENEKKKKTLAAGDKESEAARQPWLRTFSLRGSNYVRGGSSIDYFDWYRLGENAFVWETTERDKIVGQFTSLLCDVQRAMARETGSTPGIYIKPHRAQTVTIPRTLAAISRGIQWIYWYTYGPEWGKGDNFCNPFHFSQVSKVARLLRAAENVTYDSSWAVPAEVAWVSSLSGEKWRTAHPYPEKEWHIASWEDAKWIHTALAHAHIPVDAVDERILEEKDLSQYKVIYAITPVLTRAAAAKLEKWVKAGGTLYTSAWGLVYDEAQRPLDVLRPVLGLETRNPLDTWCSIQSTGASRQQDFTDPKFMYEIPPHDKVALAGGGNFNSAFNPMLGREILQPSAGTETLVKFADGSAAVTRKPYGAGQAYVVGLWPGIEYSHKVRRNDLDMTKDFNPAIRQYATAPALEKTRPVVDIAEPCVEGILLKNNQTGKQAVTLANWAAKTVAMTQTTDNRGRTSTGYRHESVVFENLKVRIRGAGSVRKVTSLWLEKELPVTRDGDYAVVTLPRLEEGDILLVE